MIDAFTHSAGPPLSVAELTALVKAGGPPADIDRALLARSKNPPFYPDDAETEKFFIDMKHDPALDARLLEAAKISAPARAAELLKNRTANMQGAFTHFICPDPQNPLNSKIFKVIRAPHIGPGTGAWGGLKEGEDVDVHVTVNREVYEEVIDAVKMLLKAEGEAKREQAFDACLKAAFTQKRPLSEGVADFVSALGDAPALQSRVGAFTALAGDLIADLVAADKQKLFQCRDDGHIINRGWGYKVDAFAHVAGISKETADKFETLRQTVETLKGSAVAKGAGTVAGEMQGIAVYTLADAPEQVKKSWYGHEGFAEIAGFARIANLRGEDAENFWDKCRQSGAVDVIAEKMRLSPWQLYGLYHDVRGADGAGYLSIPDAAYKAAADKQPFPFSVKPPA